MLLTRKAKVGTCERSNASIVKIMDMLLTVPRSGATTTRSQDTLLKTVQLFPRIAKLLPIKLGLVLVLLPVQVVTYWFFSFFYLGIQNNNSRTSLSWFVDSDTSNHMISSSNTL